MSDSEAACDSGAKWFPYNKGGGFRKWYGNNYYLVNWEKNGEAIISHPTALRGCRDATRAPMSGNTDPKTRAKDSSFTNRDSDV